VPMPRLRLRAWSRGWRACCSQERDAGRCRCGHASQPAGHSPETVRELVDAQFPPWRALAIKPVDSQGTVNAIFRIGDHLAAVSLWNPVIPERRAGTWSARREQPASWPGAPGSPRPSR
jgi:hypothetical protein